MASGWLARGGPLHRKMHVESREGTPVRVGSSWTRAPGSPRPPPCPPSRHGRLEMLTTCPLLASIVVSFAAAPSESSPAPSYDPQTGELVEPVGVALPGERIDPALHGPGWIESMADVTARQDALPIGPQPARRTHMGEPGVWRVPTRKSTYFAHSGRHYATVTWGDREIGLGFGGPVDLGGAWIAGQGAAPGWASGLRVTGYRDGIEVASTAWFEDVDAEPSWFAMDLAGVDRIVFHARPSTNGSGYFGLDDLTFTRAGEDAATVLTFDDLTWRTPLTGSGYGGLEWETGAGRFGRDDVGIVHPPQSPKVPVQDPSSTAAPGFLGGGGTAPTLGTNYRGPRINDNGAGWLPPDTCGAVGTNHYVAVVNQHISVYVKDTGVRLVNTSLGNFFNTSVGVSEGDPRVAYDHYDDRWIVTACDFSTGIWLAVSMTDDANGNWFKTFVTLSAGSDAGNWPDYPTLGFDQEGLYVAAYMVGGNFLMSLFAIDKAPLLTANPSVGTVSAWRQLPWDGAIQPCVTHDDPGPEYCISRKDSNELRLRRVDGPLTNPTMTPLGTVFVPNGSSPPSVPALGSNDDLSTVGPRPMNAVHRNGSVWTANTVSVNGRAAARWYEVDPVSVTTNQIGTIADTELHYMFPSIAVDADDAVLVGMSAAGPNLWPGAFYAGRIATDPAGETSTPIEYQPGLAPYNGGGGSPQRFGDYSLTNVDPVDDSLWTIQEYSDSNQSWSTWIAQLDFPPVFPPPLAYCSGKVNSIGLAPQIAWTGTPSVTTNDFALETTHLLGPKPGLVFHGSGQAVIPFFNATLCTNPPLVRGPVTLSDTFGFFQQPLTYQVGEIGTTRNYQWWYRDTDHPDGTGVGLSNAAEVTVQP